MSTTKVQVAPDVLTLDEAARYLRLPKPKVRRLAADGQLPGRQVGKDWRILKSALDGWLQGSNALARLVRQAGALADDENLNELRRRIYVERGRPEVDEGAPG
jgi:excisionase family DNA binding protein